MKFVHIADMHFDSPFVNLSDKESLGDLRRLDQRKAFKKVIEYIKENKIKYLFISGDLYEQKYIKKSTIEYINNLFKEIPETKIFISPGNHDPYIKNSYYYKFNWSENVKIFSSKIEKIELEDADIYGFGFDDFYCKDFNIKELNILWDIYTCICCTCRIKPTLMRFCIMVGIDATTMTTWVNGEYRVASGHSKSAQKWKSECESTLYDEVIQTGNIGCMFALKANYGYRDNIQIIQSDGRDQLPEYSREEIAARAKIVDMLPESPEDLPE